LQDKIQKLKQVDDRRFLQNKMKIRTSQIIRHLIMIHTDASCQTPYAMLIDPREECNCSLTSRTINTTGHRRFPTGGRRFTFYTIQDTRNVAMFDILKTQWLMLYVNLDTKITIIRKSYFLLPIWAKANCPLAHKMVMNRWLAHTSQICYRKCIKYNYFHQ